MKIVMLMQLAFFLMVGMVFAKLVDYRCDAIRRDAAAKIIISLPVNLLSEIKV